MKKMIAIAAAMLLVVPVLAMAGMTAFDNMTELGPEMGEITGQTGISIDQSVDLSVGYIAWTDDDGFGTTVTQNQGALTLDTVSFDDGTGSAVDIIGQTIDVGSDGTTSYLAIGMPAITGELTISAIRIGTAADLGGSLGALTINGLSTVNSTMKIYAH